MLARSLGGIVSGLYRLLSYLFLRWIAGRHGVVLPFLYVLSLLCFWTNQSGRLPADRAESKSQAVEADTKPSYAAIAAANATPEQSPTRREQQLDSPSAAATAPSTPTATNGSAKKRKKQRARLLHSMHDERPILPEPTAKTAGQSLTSLLTGAPTISRPINMLNLLINTLLLAAVLDMMLVPYVAMEEKDLAFSRLGHVDHQSATIFARFPEASLSTNMTATSDTTARIAWRQTKPMSTKWALGPVLNAEEGNDFTSTATLNGLWASTEYEYRLLTRDGSSHHPSFPRAFAFVTAPDPRLSSATGSHFSFASTSCIRPGFPYRGPHKKREIVGARLLHQFKSQLSSLRFLIAVGDTIYADNPLAPAPKEETYQKRYRQTFASPDMKALVEDLPSYYIYDDHEIKNDFSYSEEHEAFRPAVAAYNTYLGRTNPQSYLNESYYHFTHGDATFFVLDTRRYRSPNSAPDDSDKTMLGPVQKARFLQWLGQVNQTSTWHFVVSSVPFMTLWSHGDDTWAGFTTERDEIMDVLQYVPNVIILSGDRHEFAAASIRTTVTEFSTSPLNQFYLPVRTLSQRHGRGATGEDVLLKYLPDGNTKFTIFEVDNRIQNKPVVRVSVIIDGQEAWKVEVQGKSVRAPISTVGGLAKSIFELLGFKRRSWFA